MSVKIMRRLCSIVDRYLGTHPIARARCALKYLPMEMTDARLPRLAPSPQRRPYVKYIVTTPSTKLDAIKDMINITAAIAIEARMPSAV